MGDAWQDVPEYRSTQSNLPRYLNRAVVYLRRDRDDCIVPKPSLLSHTRRTAHCLFNSLLTITEPVSDPRHSRQNHTETMSSTSTSSFPLATEQPCTTDCGDSAGTANSAGTVNSDAGASGSSGGTFALSDGGIIAIIVIVVLCALIGSKSRSSVCSRTPS